MPILGPTAPPQDNALSFTSLSALDDWYKTHNVRRFDAVLPYAPRSNIESDNAIGRGQLLVCHDYKGGYKESPFALQYTFNFWAQCKIFVYFAHDRITAPPPGWTTAAHRQGVKMLGTLIFELGAEEDCLNLLIGPIPASPQVNLKTPAQVRSFPASAYYARLLAELARDRGFDGYLLNFECPFQGGYGETRALTAWISLLRMELKAQVGTHAEVIWYDSLVPSGNISYQNRLNASNLPFFIPSTGIFSNYWWRQGYPAQSATYFSTLSPSVLIDSREEPKPLNDIYMGVDVWGRKTYGGGGLNTYLALQDVQPQSSGVSVALFAPGWTWESQEDEPGFTWENWWKFERSLWVGLPDSGEPAGFQDPDDQSESSRTPKNVPITDFFTLNPPPNPLVLPFHTTFSPGVGRAWFVDGAEKFSIAAGWTDIDKQCTLGDLAWKKSPSSSIFYPRDNINEDVRVNFEVFFDDAWNGGSSLRLTISSPPRNNPLSFDHIDIPIQSLSLTPGIPYQLVAIYKDEPAWRFDTEVHMKVMGSDVQVIHENINRLELENGWIKLSAQVTLPTPPNPALRTDATVSIGLKLLSVTIDSVQASQLSLLVGQMNVYPSTVDSNVRPTILFLDYQTAENSSTTSGTLTWEVAASNCPPPDHVPPPNNEDPIPAWDFEPCQPWLPEFLYFNVYMGRNSATPANARMWIGTSGLGSQRCAFHVEMANLPWLGLNGGLGKSEAVFYVQGVNTRGEVLPWEDCAAATFVL